MEKDRVRLNFGGRIFETTTTTLANVCRNFMFGAMFDENWNYKTSDDEHFIDRNPDPDVFAVLLDLLRTGNFSSLGIFQKDYCTEKPNFTVYWTKTGQQSGVHSREIGLG